MGVDLRWPVACSCTVYGAKSFTRNSIFKNQDLDSRAVLRSWLRSVKPDATLRWYSSRMLSRQYMRLYKLQGQEAEGMLCVHSVQQPQLLNDNSKNTSNVGVNRRSCPLSRSMSSSSLPLCTFTILPYSQRFVTERYPASVRPAPLDDLSRLQTKHETKPILRCRRVDLGQWVREAAPRPPRLPPWSLCASHAP